MISREFQMKTLTILVIIALPSIVSAAYARYLPTQSLNRMEQFSIYGAPEMNSPTVYTTPTVTPSSKARLTAFIITRKGMVASLRSPFGEPEPLIRQIKTWSPTSTFQKRNTRQGSGFSSRGKIRTSALPKPVR